MLREDRHSVRMEPRVRPKVPRYVGLIRPHRQPTRLFISKVAAATMAARIVITDPVHSWSTDGSKKKNAQKKKN